MPQSSVNAQNVSVDGYISGRTKINDAARRVWCMCRAVNFLSGDPDKVDPIRIYFFDQEQK